MAIAQISISNKNDPQYQMTARKYTIPFEFILDNLITKEVVVKPMFGCYRLYIGNQICFFLRDRNDQKELNGIWVVLNSPHDYESLANELPSINQDKKLHNDKKSTNTWLLLSAFDPDFESLEHKVCELILNNDKRIGKITNGSLLNT